MPSGEREIRPRESLWIAAPQKPRWVYPVFGLVFFNLPNVARMLTRDLLGERASWAFFAFTLVSLGAVFVVVERRARRITKGDAALMDGAFGEQFPIEATFVSEKQTLGTDRGVLWFADGLMGFSGAAASFVLAAADVWADRPDLIRNAKHRKQQIVVEFRDAPREGQVEIVPLRGHEDAVRERLAAFLAADAPPEGERFWPPLVPYRAFEEGEPLSPQGL